MAKKPRLKAAAQAWAAQSDADVATTIRDIGDVNRELIRLQAAMNDEIAIITQRYQEQISPVQERLLSLQSGVQVWCEANRERLTEGGKVKSHNFVTGQIQWRVRPPSCTVRGADSVIELLKVRSLERFVRVKEEVNKEAILNEPDSVKDVPGISINTGIEDFVIEPFEQTADAH